MTNVKKYLLKTYRSELFEFDLDSVVHEGLQYPNRWSYVIFALQFADECREYFYEYIRDYTGTNIPKDGWASRFFENEDMTIEVWCRLLMTSFSMGHNDKEGHYYIYGKPLHNEDGSPKYPNVIEFYEHIWTALKRTCDAIACDSAHEILEFDKGGIICR